VQLPPRVGAIKYAGEISGKLGSRTLLSPRAIAVDQNGNLYIADTGNNRIVKLDREFGFVSENGGFGAAVGALNRPLDIVSDGGINFYVLDQGNRRVMKLDYNLIFGDEIRFDDNPDLITVGDIVRIGYSNYGRLFLLDPDNLRVLMLDTDYALERSIVAPGGFADCEAINIVHDGSAYIYDEGEQTLYHFDAFGNSADKITLEGVGALGDFVMSSGGYIIATDRQRNEIVVLDSSGRKLLTSGSYGSGPGNLNSPVGMALRIDGTLFVCDAGNNRITYYDVIPQ
jgi:tripartite motif-containing protein 71